MEKTTIKKKSKEESLNIPQAYEQDNDHERKQGLIRDLNSLMVTKGFVEMPSRLVVIKDNAGGASERADAGEIRNGSQLMKRKC